VAFKPRGLPDFEIHFPVTNQSAHLLNTMRRGTEIIAAMHQRHAFRHRNEIERPVERRIPAANNQNRAIAKGLNLADRIINALLLIGFDFRDRRLFGLERPTARRNQNGLCLKNRVAIGLHAKERAVAVPRLSTSLTISLR